MNQSTHPNSPHNRRRAARDFYRSPHRAIRDLIAGIGKPPLDTIWLDVCSGDGRLARPLIQMGYNVRTIDIHDYDPGGCPFLIEGDFLAMTELPEGVTRIVSNPPFDKTLSAQIVRHALHLLPPKGIAHFLFNSSWINAKSRADIARHALPPVLVGRYQMPPCVGADGRVTPDLSEADTAAQVQAVHDANLAQYKRAKAAAIAAGKSLPKRPVKPKGKVEHCWLNLQKEELPEHRRAFIHLGSGMA